MNRNELEIQPPSDELLAYLDVTQSVVGERYLPTDYRQHLRELHSISALRAIESDREHPLWWFLPPILYDIFDEKSKFDWLEQEDTASVSLIVIPPPFKSIVDQIREETADWGIETAASTRVYSRQFLGLIYGGYPWFESYLRLADANDLIGCDCIFLTATSASCDVPDTLAKFKKKRRNAFGQSIQMAFDDLPYPGVLRPFHAPSRIETRRHTLAAVISE
jgi:hypothetical protein